MSAAESADWARPRPREIDFYQTVVDAGRVLGWRVHHQRSTREGTAIQGDPGFPDFVLCHPRGHILFVELKSDRKGAHLSPAQQQWRDALIAAGARWYVIYVPTASNHIGMGLDDLLSMLHDLATTT